MVESELSLGRKVLIYAQYTEVGKRLEQILGDNFPDFKVGLLTANIDGEKRAAWIKDKNPDILIANPELVKTGLDLYDYPTIIFHQTGTVTSTLEQASRRAWRIGQKQECKVYFLVYEATAQLVSLKLMSKKIKASNNLRGRLVVSRNELSALADNESSLQAALADSLLKNDEMNSEGIDSKWVFTPRELDAFESYYTNFIPTNNHKSNALENPVSSHIDEIIIDGTEDFAAAPSKTEESIITDSEPVSVESFVQIVTKDGFVQLGFNF